jgi:hypothetical protein
MRKYLFVTGLALVVLAMMVVATPSISGKTTASEATIINVVSSNRDGVTLELTVPGVAVEPLALDGQRYDALTVPGFTTGIEPGHPDLPRKTALLGIPPGAELSVSATVLELETLPGTYRLAPVPHWTVRDEGEGRSVDLSQVEALEPVYAPDKAIYATKSPYPAEPARIAHVGTVRSQRVASLELAPFQYTPASGELRLVRRLRVHVAFHYPDTTPQSLGTARAEETTFERILSRTLLNYEAARSWRVDPSQIANAPLTAPPWTPPDPAWKIQVNRTGLYHLSYTDLQAAGLPVETLDPQTFQLYNQGAEVAIHVAGQEDGTFDDGDYVEFYGVGLDTLYTDTNVYWLTHGGVAGLRIPTWDGTPGSAPMPSTFTTTVRVEENHLYWSNAGGNDRWFWKSMYAVPPTHSPSEPLSELFTGTLGLIAPEPHTCTVGISLYGTTYNNSVNPDHHALVYLNDHLIHDAWWDHQMPYSTTVEVSSAHLDDITNTFRVDMPADTGSSYDGIYVNGFTVECAHPYRAVGDELAFTQEQSGTWQYRVRAFSGPDILAFDVTDPARIVSLTGEVSLDSYRVFLPLIVKGQAGLTATTDRNAFSQGGNELSYSFHFQDTVSGTAEYLVLAAGQTREPLSVVPDMPSNLADTANQADYIMIAHDDLYTDTLPLAAYWGTQGLTVTVVRISDVYDEFGYGIFDPTAIRDFLTHAYDNWQAPQLTYVLLVGDATYDYRDYRGFGVPPNIPTYLLPSPFIGEAGSDNWYACVSGDDHLPDLHIGRLPAGSAAQLDVMVDKILDYAQNPAPGTWNQEVLFVADDKDAAGDFAAYSDVLVNGYLPPAYTPNKVYFKITHTTQPSVTAAITGTINTTGTLLINYIGHGAIFSWAHERLFMCYGSRCDFDGMNNGGKLPFVVSMTCADGYYVHPDPAFTSLAENWLLKDGGGGVATFAATGLGVASGHDWMNRGLFTAIFTDTQALGPATTESKLYMHNQTGGGYQDLVETYHLFGDPALPLNLP